VSGESIDVLLDEERTFPPPPEFAAQAVVNDNSVYEQADRDLDGFWLARTAETVGWFQQPSIGLEWDPPHCTWFRDGSLNASHSCLDRHVEAGNGERAAYHFVPEDPAEPERAISYRELHAMVCRTANALRDNGVWLWSAAPMGMVPSRRWRCWPAPGWGTCTWWCSEVLCQLAGRAAGGTGARRRPPGRGLPQRGILLRDRGQAAGSRRTDAHGAAPKRRRRRHAGGPRPLVTTSWSTGSQTSARPNPCRPAQLSACTPPAPPLPKAAAPPTVAI
jgi:hypothetical protein